jgi:putative DNA primase/helicase
MNMKAVAIDYTKKGWQVFPLAAAGKQPVTKHGFHDATTERSQIDLWWTASGRRNIGIATGERSGIVVIDLDGPDGLAEWQSIAAPHEPISTLTSLTGGGGAHLLFKWPGIAINNSPISENIHVRADGGYIVAPPSVHPNGTPYRWQDENVAVADMPVWLLELLISGRGKGATPSLSPSEPQPVIDSSSSHTGNRLSMYAAAALKSACDRIRSAGEGKRNDTLNREAFSLGAFIRDNHIDRATVEMELRGAALGAGLVEREIEKTLSSAIDGALSRSRRTIEPRPSTPLGMAADEIEQHSEEARKVLTAAPLTDAGNAECIAHLYGDRLRYDHISKSWRVWDGQRWRVDHDCESTRLALATVRARRQAFHTDGALSNDDRVKGFKFSLTSENQAKLMAALSHAQSLIEFATLVQQYDRNRMLVCAGDVTIDLDTVTPREHRREDLITLMLGTQWDPEATAPRWLQFINELWPDAPAMHAYIQRAFGYCLTGDIREQAFFLCHGNGRNGKSTLFNVLRALAGEYSSVTDFTTFDADTQESRSDLAKLRAARVVTVSESNEDTRLAEARIKAVTGGEAITARELYGKPFDYVPQFKLWMAMNHLPTIRGADNGIWRRIHLIEFNQNFEGREDKQLEQKLRAELPGILNWALDGLREWHAQGLNPPADVVNATKAYRADQDLIGRWVSDCCVLGAREQVQSSLAYESYVQWCQRVNVREQSLPLWGRRMKERGFTDRTLEGRTFYVGIGLKGQL